MVFNCKNVKTSVQAIDELLEGNHFIMLQEHWLFQNQINLLGEVAQNINFVGKGVDKYNQLEPKYLPRGYGGVAILWSKNVDHVVKPLEDGKERIQAIEIKGKNEEYILLVSVYLPATGGKENITEFCETVDQMYEICQKYQKTHHIIFGGDLNEDLGNASKNSKRKQYLLNFIRECELHYTVRGKTFIRPNGEECSELDYFLYTLNDNRCTEKGTIESDE